MTSVSVDGVTPTSVTPAVTPAIVGRPKGPTAADITIHVAFCRVDDAPPYNTFRLFTPITAPAKIEQVTCVEQVGSMSQRGAISEKLSEVKTHGSGRARSMIPLKVAQSSEPPVVLNLNDLSAITTLMEPTQSALPNVFIPSPLLCFQGAKTDKDTLTAVTNLKARVKLVLIERLRAISAPNALVHVYKTATGPFVWTKDQSNVVKASVSEGLSCLMKEDFKRAVFTSIPVTVNMATKTMSLMMCAVVVCPTSNSVHPQSAWSPSSVAVSSHLSIGKMPSAVISARINRLKDAEKQFIAACFLPQKKRHLDASSPQSTPSAQSSEAEREQKTRPPAAAAAAAASPSVRIPGAPSVAPKTPDVSVSVPPAATAVHVNGGSGGGGGGGGDAGGGGDGAPAEPPAKRQRISEPAAPVPSSSLEGGALMASVVAERDVLRAKNESLRMENERIKQECTRAMSAFKEQMKSAPDTAAHELRTVMTERDKFSAQVLALEAGLAQETKNGVGRHDAALEACSLLAKYAARPETTALPQFKGETGLWGLELPLSETRDSITALMISARKPASPPDLTLKDVKTELNSLRDFLVASMKEQQKTVTDAIARQTKTMEMALLNNALRRNWPATPNTDSPPKPLCHGPSASAAAASAV